MNATPPPVHVPRPYARPTVPLAAHHEVARPDGATIHAFAYGPHADATPVLFLHGNGEEHGIFGPVIDDVVRAGHPALAIDTRAQGQSSRGTEPLSYELFVDDVLAVLDKLGVARTHVAGFSDGGIEGLLLARDHAERVASLTCIGANLTPEGLGAEDLAYMREAAAANRTWAEDGTEGVTLEDGTPVPSPAEAAQIAELLQLMVDEPHIDASSLAAIACPTCVMAGELDVILPEETQAIANNVPGARLVIVPEVDHNLPKLAPEAVTRELLATMAQV